MVNTHGLHKSILSLMLLLILGSAVLWGAYWLITYISTPGMNDLQRQKEELDAQMSLLSDHLLRQKKYEMPTTFEMQPYLLKVSSNRQHSDMIRQLERLSNVTGLQLKWIQIGESTPVSVDLLKQIYLLIQSGDIPSPALVQEIGEDEFLQLISTEQIVDESGERKNAIKLKQTMIQLEYVGSDAQLQNFLAQLKAIERIVHLSYVTFARSHDTEVGTGSIELTIYHYDNDLLFP